MYKDKTILILGANSDVAKEVVVRYLEGGANVIAASRNLEEIKAFVKVVDSSKLELIHFDATLFHTHQSFYDSLRVKPHVVIYAAGILYNNEDALTQWDGAFKMMQVHYCGAVSILNIIATDPANNHLERIIGLSSLSGVRGRKSNFIYGSTKAAFTTYLAGLRQYLFSRGIIVNVIVAGYIRSKMTAGLNLPESLMLEPSFIADAVIRETSNFVVVPGIKWKIIYTILKLLPEKLVARLP